MAANADFLAILHKYWGYDDFRGIQRQIIESVSAGRDTMGLMPTGGGKSITFQVPALAQEGLCLVVTPLIALMKDQVAQLRRRGIRAEAIYMGMRREEVIQALENCIFGPYKFLYVSPERLGSELFQKKLARMNVTLITVDEAHCISQWGYDFRPSYLDIARIRPLFPKAPVLALTATATPEVCEDIMHRLEFRQPNLIRMSFRRDNLIYVVRRTDDMTGEIHHILNSLEGSAIIYMRNREGSARLAQELTQAGFSATCYHAGLDRITREGRQDKWTRGETRIMVATNAFGMGIDKPDVRVVIHTDPPPSPEEYFQEAGRAGRDGQAAYAVMLTTSQTLTTLNRRVAETFPEPDVVKAVYEHLCYYYTLAVNDGMGVSHDFNIDDFCVKFRHYPTLVISCLKLLQMAGYIRYDEESERQSRLLFLIQRHDLYKLEGLNRHDDEVLRTILRLYGGIFADYVFVNEHFVAQTADVSPDEVYQLLITLARRHIISYIPARNVPRITFTRRRCPTERLVIPQEIYAERQERYRRRIGAMATYLSTTTQCRSAQLLDYLGEHDAAPCRRCDVCLSRDTDGIPVWQATEAARHIDTQLASGEWVSITALQHPTLPQALAAAYLEQLIQTEQIERDGTLFRLHRQ